MGISQDPAGSQGTPGEYGNFTRRGVEDAAPYKARVLDRQLVRVGSASPRLPRPLWGLAMTNRDWCRFNDGLYGLPVRRRERHAAPLQGRCGRRSATNATACMALRERRYIFLSRGGPFGASQ